IMHSRVRKKLGGELEDAGIESEEKLVRTYEEYEREQGPYDLTTGEHYTVGAGKLLSIIQELEDRYGGNMIARYFRAAREWQKVLRKRGATPVDRMAFYFSVAAAEDLFPYFKEKAFPGSDLRRTRSSATGMVIRDRYTVL
ncbi:MAG: hypothetical protein R6U98_00485, partial [Pirellulaceae bacterium]